jgi:hypothetical protein
MLRKHISYRFCDLDCREHSRLDASDVDVGEYNIHLSDDSIDGQMVHILNAKRVLCGNGCYHGGAVHAESSKGARVGLYPSPAS